MLKKSVSMLFKLYKKLWKDKDNMSNIKILSSMINNYKKLTLMNIISKFILKYLTFMKGKREFPSISLSRLGKNGIRLEKIL